MQWSLVILMCIVTISNFVILSNIKSRQITLLANEVKLNKVLQGLVFRKIIRRR